MTGEVHYGIVKVHRGAPPSRSGNVTLNVWLPAELARAWPVNVTHVHVVADEEGLHLYPADPPANRTAGRSPRVPPFGEA